MRTPTKLEAIFLVIIAMLCIALRVVTNIEPTIRTFRVEYTELENETIITATEIH